MAKGQTIPVCGSGEQTLVLLHLQCDLNQVIYKENPY